MPRTKTNPAFDIVLKVVRDTSEGFAFEILELLYKNPKLTQEQLALLPIDKPHDKRGLSKDQLACLIGISETHIYNLLTKDMEPVGIVEKVTVGNGSGKRGRNTHLWTLTEELLLLCRKVRL